MISFTPFEPTFLTIFGLQFRYYGLMYVLIFLICYFWINHVRQTGKLKINIAIMGDLLFYGLLGLILGARIGYIIFYNFSYYLENPLKIFAVWEGGMSFHGGLIGLALTGYLFCKIKKLSFLKIADLLIIPLSIGISLGRVGNFINGELYGRPLSETFYVPWGMYFAKAGNDVLRHPSQIYEGIRDILIFTILFFIYKKYPDLKSGILLSLFLILYGSLRFLIEFVREPDPQLGLFWNMFSMGQILSGIMVGVGIIGFVVIRKR